MATGWKKDPKEEQNFWCEATGDIEFDEYELDTDAGSVILLRKVGFAIYGFPRQQPSAKNVHTGYDEKQLKHLKSVAESIKKVNAKNLGNKNLLQMSIVFVYVEKDQQLMQFPVFRVVLTRWERKFVDTDCRVYSTWAKFLTENELPAGKFCWPEGGIYHTDPEGNVKIGWGTTPNAGIHRKVLGRADTMSSVAILGPSGVIIIATLAPATALVIVAAGVCAGLPGVYLILRNLKALVDHVVYRPTVNPLSSTQVVAILVSMICVAIFGSSVLIISCALAPEIATAAAAACNCAVVGAVYLAVRGAAALVDRVAHGQTIDPLYSTQAAASWLSVVGSTVGLAVGVMVSHMMHLTQSSQVMTKMEQATCNTLNIMSLAVNATGVGFRACSITQRFKEGELTALHVSQFSASVLFFAHSTMNFETASAIMQRNQKSIFGDYEKVLKKQFRNSVKNTKYGIETLLYGGKKIVRRIHNIDDVDYFFTGMEKTENDYIDYKLVFSNNGNIIIGGGVEIDPMKMYYLEKQQSFEVLSLAREVSNGVISDVTFADSFNKFSTSDEVTSENLVQTLEAERILSTQLQTMLRNCSIGLAEIKLGKVIVDKLTELVYQHTNNKYVKCWHKIWSHVSKLMQEMMNTYKDARQFEALFRHFMNGEKLDLEKIRQVTAFVYFILKIYDRYKNHIGELIHDIKSWRMGEE